MAGKRKPKKSVSRAEITEAALALIDDKGLDGFSIRNLAQALSVFPTALYWYFPARIDILEAVAQRVTEGITPPPSADWRAWMRDFAQNLRAAIARHPNVAPLIGGQLVSNSAADLAMLEGVLSHLAQAGLADEALVQGYNMVMGGLVGFVTQEFARAPEDGEAPLRDRLNARCAEIDPNAHPVLHAHRQALMGRAFVLRWENGQHQPMETAYSRLVESLIAGLERMSAA